MTKNDTGGLRISSNFQQAPSNLYFAQHWPRIGQGFEEHLDAFLDAHPDVALVIVDVYKRVKPENRSAGSAYDIDYDAAAPLQAFARRRRITILMVHHTRKKQMGADNDPIEMVSGSMGLTAAVDGILVLTRQANGMGRLQAAGREVEGRDLLLKHQPKSGIWKLVGDVEESSLSNARKEILDLLEDVGPLAPKQIALTLDKDGSTVRTLLSKLLKEGQINRGEDGKYLVEGKTGDKQPKQQEPEAD